MQSGMETLFFAGAVFLPSNMIRLISVSDGLAIISVYLETVWTADFIGDNLICNGGPAADARNLMTSKEVRVAATRKPNHPKYQ